MKKICRRTLRLAVAGAALLSPALSDSTTLAQSTGLLSGYVYVDRNNDGQLAFSNQPMPEFVIPNVTIQLFSRAGNTATLLTSTQTNSVGRYEFTGLAAGTYALQQMQPVQFVDGLDTVGFLRNLMLGPPPAGANPGVSANNLFDNIVLVPNTRGDGYNFGERGLAPAYVSKRYLMGYAPPPELGTPAPIPEPAAGVLATLAGLALLARRRR